LDISLIGSFILATVVSGEVNRPLWALKAYGSSIEFQVKRNGKSIGKHLVEFAQENEILTVTSTTRMRIKFLFITAYKFDYLSTETWGASGLQTVNSFSNDDGEKTTSYFPFSENMEILPTNHWNPDVINSSIIFNTITGENNNVKIVFEGEEEVLTGAGVRSANKYRYSGDLFNVWVWYDTQDRWVRLEFQGNDGSRITYQCIVCGQS